MRDVIDLVSACAAAFTAIGGVLVAIKVLIPSLNIAKSTHHVVLKQTEILKANGIEKAPEDGRNPSA
jgi:hypothetical protein